MDNKKPSVYGHSYLQVYFISENGVYTQVEQPGGAHFIFPLINAIAAEIANDPNIEKVRTNWHIPDDLERIYMELKRFEIKGEDRCGYAVKRRLGRAKTDKGIEPVYIKGGGENLVVFDEGFGKLDIPAGYKNVLWASNKVMPDREQFKKISENCLLLIDADVLRSAGAMISRGISWEKTASELIWQLNNNASVSYLLEAPEIIISFAEDGAVHIKRGEDGSFSANLVLTHGGAEGMLREGLNSESDRVYALMVFVISVSMFFMPGVPPAKAALSTAEYVLHNGEFNTDEDDNTIGLHLQLHSIDIVEKAFPIPIVNGSVPDNWCAADNFGGRKLYDTAFDYVLYGSKIIEGLPHITFGHLTTVDRREIESYQNIRNLIIGYERMESVKPLSIAVFGAPGSGKSFGVTQIAKNVLPGRVEKLEFNVSQFSGPHDLAAAFQRVRDVILEGKLPLVFFDEFDSDRDGAPLGWIKSFLMPMQDGKFKDESGEHPLGKCVLVFAGGTATSYFEFITNKDPDDFKNVKGPDFISRLKGTINVLGPNARNVADKNYILRRALLLRSICERRLGTTGGRLNINDNILRAMLLVPSFKHGARSMEAILEMSRLEGDYWEPAALPYHLQLDLHVSPKEFLNLVLEGYKSTKEEHDFEHIKVE